MSNLTVEELTKLAKSRLEEAEILLASQKYDAAVYLGGYAIELAIKAKICQVLRWSELPPSAGDCKKISDKLYNKDFIKTHNVADLSDFLFCLSGSTTAREIDRADLRIAWSNFSTHWSEQNRYKPIGSLTELEADGYLKYIRELLTFFLL